MKKAINLTIITALIFSASLIQAQLVTSWTADMASSKIPTGVSLTDADTLTNPISIRFEIDLDATTYDNSNKVTAFNAIGTATKAELDTNWVVPQWRIDTTLAATGVYVIESINRVWDDYDHPDHIEQYGEAEDVYRVRGRFKYLADPE